MQNKYTYFSFECFLDVIRLNGTTEQHVPVQYSWCQNENCENVENPALWQMKERRACRRCNTLKGKRSTNARIQSTQKKDREIHVKWIIVIFKKTTNQFSLKYVTIQRVTWQSMLWNVTVQRTILSSCLKNTTKFSKQQNYEVDNHWLENLTMRRTCSVTNTCMSIQ